MWWPWFLSLLFLASTFASEIGTLFNLLGGTGTCDVSTMDAFLADAKDLADAFDSAITAILDEPAEIDGYVARSLLDSWLGISMDADSNWVEKTDIQGEKWEDYTEQWQRVRDVNDQVKSFLAGNALNAPGSPELLCGGNGFRPFEWTDSVMEWDPVNNQETVWEIDESDVQISEVYDSNSASLPYLLQNNHKYYVVRDDLSRTNICNPEDLTKQGPFSAHVFAGQAAVTRTVMAQPVFIDGISPLLVMCPTALEEGSLTALIAEADERVIGETTINTINWEIPGPATLFHELIHLTSFWTKTAGGAFTKSANYIDDYTYNARECLEMASTGIELTNVEKPEETKVYTPGDASLNAESYTLFALSYWYFLEMEQTFYWGLLVDWQYTDSEEVAKRSVDRARHYGRRFGHSHNRTRH